MYVYICWWGQWEVDTFWRNVVIWKFGFIKPRVKFIYIQYSLKDYFNVCVTGCVCVLVYKICKVEMNEKTEIGFEFMLYRYTLEHTHTHKYTLPNMVEFRKPDFLFGRFIDRNVKILYNLFGMYNISILAGRADYFI